MIYGMIIHTKNAIKMLMLVGQKKTMKHFMAIKIMQRLIRKVNS